MPGLKHGGHFTRLYSAICCLLLGSAQVAATASFISVSACAQAETTGAAPAADADMKKIVLNIFGMT